MHFALDRYFDIRSFTAYAHCCLDEDTTVTAALWAMWLRKDFTYALTLCMRKVKWQGGKGRDATYYRPSLTMYVSLTSRGLHPGLADLNQCDLNR